MNRHEYKGYYIFMERHGTGWRAMIRVPNNEKLIPGPSSSDSYSEKAVLAEAKMLIDRGAI